MSDFHVLDVTPNKDQARIAIHVSVPAGNNSAGRPWNTVLLEYLGGTQATAVPWLASSDPVEAGMIGTGDVYEAIETVRFNANESNANKLAAMQTHVANRQSEITARLAEALKFWGFDGDIP